MLNSRSQVFSDGLRPEPSLAGTIAVGSPNAIRHQEPAYWDGHERGSTLWSATGVFYQKSSTRRRWLAHKRRIKRAWCPLRTYTRACCSERLAVSYDKDIAWKKQAVLRQHCTQVMTRRGISRRLFPAPHSITLERRVVRGKSESGCDSVWIHGLLNLTQLLTNLNTMP